MPALARLTLPSATPPRITGLARVTEESDGTTKASNLTLINLVLKLLGPTHEQSLTIILLALQVRHLQSCAGVAPRETLCSRRPLCSRRLCFVHCQATCSLAAFVLRYGLVTLFFDHTI